ncbi:MAG: Rab family GTPase [Candidatus Hodarchaeales archaeon]|jgi:small GTP-binding protein
MSDEDIFFEIPHHSQYKLVVVGDGLVGKTQLVSVFTKRAFEHKPTAGADISFLKLRGSGEEPKTTTAIFWDLSGQQAFDKVRSLFYEGAHAVIYVMDVSRKDTALALPSWVKEVKKALSDTPAILIGNKIDLKDQREVTDDIGLKFADRLHAQYFPTSAVTGEGVGTAFASAIRRAVAYRDSGN